MMHWHKKGLNCCLGQFMNGWLGSMIRSMYVLFDCSGKVNLSVGLPTMMHSQRGYFSFFPLPFLLFLSLDSFLLFYCPASPLTTSMSSSSSVSPSHYWPNYFPFWSMLLLKSAGHLMKLLAEPNHQSSWFNASMKDYFLHDLVYNLVLILKE